MSSRSHTCGIIIITMMMMMIMIIILIMITNRFPAHDELEVRDKSCLSTVVCSMECSMEQQYCVVSRLSYGLNQDSCGAL